MNRIRIIIVIIINKHISMNKFLQFGQFSFIALIVLASICSCCDEIPPEITPCQTDRVVLVEEFTGIDCVNCPTGSEKIEQIASQNPGKVIVVGIHAGFFATNHNGFDLRCADGQSLEQYLGPVQGYPAATINRKIFPDENQLPLGLSQWAGLINSEICNRPIVNLALTPAFNSNDTTATITVDITPTSYFSDNLDYDMAVTVMITENNIVGYQKTPTGSDTAYVHKHVLRDVLSTDYKGDVIITKGNIVTAQQVVISDYKIPAGWDPDNCYVVAFVHNKGSNIEVHQAAEKHLTH